MTFVQKIRDLQRFNKVLNNYCDLDPKHITQIFFTIHSTELTLKLNTLTESFSRHSGS